MGDVVFNTDVMVYASLPACRGHAACRNALRDQLDEGMLYLTAGVVADWITTVTDPNKFKPPAPMGAAVANVKHFLSHEKVQVLASGDAVVRCMIGLLERHPELDASDAMLLATLRVAGVRTLVTVRRTFTRFDFVDVVDPTA